MNEIATHLTARSVTEQRLREELAACYRLIAHFRMTDLIFTHISVRLPGPEHHFLINPYGLMFDEITASNLVKIDLEGRVVELSPYPVNPAGFVIHSAIHGAHEDAQCVLHTHTKSSWPRKLPVSWCYPPGRGVRTHLAPVQQPWSAAGRG